MSSGVAITILGLLLLFVAVAALAVAVWQEEQADAKRGAERRQERARIQRAEAAGMLDVERATHQALNDMAEHVERVRREREGGEA